ncbi:putative transglycosylase [Mycobacterium xenopi 3993]|nr:putative transglycosylase [Mycobacterium xenopi 3993]
MTTVLPPVTDDTSPGLRDPIEEVKAALDGTRSRTPQRAPIEKVAAALDGASPPPRRRRR